jgi:hypothetical protein
MPTINIPHLFISSRVFPNVFVFPKDRVDDPGKNVLLVANLFNFKIDKDAPLRDHDLWLGLVAAPLLTAFPKAGARLVGLASRSGEAGHNLRLSLRRAKNVSISLALFLAGRDLVKPPSFPPRISVSAQGEGFAAKIEVPDGTESPRFRSVLVTLLVDRNKNTPVRLKFAK